MSDVPHLRFPEFSGEWKKHTIGELAIKVGSGVTPKGGEAVYKKEGHPFVRSQNVGLGVLLLEDIAYIDDTTHIRQKNTELQIDDVLLNITGASIGRSALVNEQIAGGNVNQHVCIIRTKDNLVSSFLCNFLLSNYGQRQIDSFQAGGNRQGLNFEQIKSIKIGIPCVEEQSKIAKTLQLLDERIATQNKVIEKLESLIKGIVDCLILKNQQNATMYNVCSISEQIKAEPNINKILTVRLHGNGVHQSSVENLDLGATQYYYRKAGQLIYGKQNFHNGAIGIIPSHLDGGITSKDIPSFDIDDTKCNPTYLLSQLQSPQYYKQAEALTTGTGSKRLKEEEFLMMRIVLPSMKEQNIIATTIKIIKEKLKCNKMLLELLLQQKQYLLRQMFI